MSLDVDVKSAASCDETRSYVLLVGIEDSRERELSSHGVRLRPKFSAGAMIMREEASSLQQAAGTGLEIWILLQQSSSLWLDQEL